VPAHAIQINRYWVEFRTAGGWESSKSKVKLGMPAIVSCAAKGSKTMTDQIKPEMTDEQAAAERRAFLAKAGKIALAAPGAALLLAATAAKAIPPGSHVT
jgi:hypothetical protein